MADKYFIRDIDLMNRPEINPRITKEKAKKILREGEVHDKPLTDKQKRFFGAIAGGQKPRS